MVEQKRGLGRGLSALLGEADEAQERGAATLAGTVRTAPIDLIQRNPDQPRRRFNEDEIEALAASIREKGVLQPILVRPSPGHTGQYQIVAGERRWRAAQKAGLHELPVIVRDFDDSEALEVAILENVQRQDLGPLEEAAGYSALIARFGHTQEAVAQAVGKSRSHVTNMMRLLTLPEPVMAWVAEGVLSAGHARALLTAADPVGLARRVIDHGLSVRETEALAKKREGSAKGAAKDAGAKDVDTMALERRLSEALGLTVLVEDKSGRGEVRVRYQTLEQLEAVCRKLGG